MKKVNRIGSYSSAVKRLVDRLFSKNKKDLTTIIKGSVIICFEKDSDTDLSPVFSMFNQEAELPVMKRDRDRDRAAFPSGQSDVVSVPQRAEKLKGGV